MHEEKEAKKKELRLEEELIMLKKNRGVIQKLKDQEQKLKWLAEDKAKTILEKRDS